MDRSHTDTLGKRVKYAREKRGLTQEELAKRAGVAQPDISKIELGKISRPTGIGGLSRALHVSTAWLELDDQPEPDWADETTQPSIAAPVADLAQTIERLGALLTEVNAVTRRGILALVGGLVDEPQEGASIGQQALVLFDSAKRRTA